MCVYTIIITCRGHKYLLAEKRHQAVRQCNAMQATNLLRFASCGRKISFFALPIVLLHLPRVTAEAAFRRTRDVSIEQEILVKCDARVVNERAFNKAVMFNLILEHGGFTRGAEDC